MAFSETLNISDRSELLVQHFNVRDSRVEENEASMSFMACAMSGWGLFCNNSLEKCWMVSSVYTNIWL